MYVSHKDGQVVGVHNALQHDGGHGDEVSIMFFGMLMNFMMHRVMVNWMVRNFMVMNRVMRVLMWVMQRFHNNFIRGVIKN